MSQIIIDFKKEIEKQGKLEKAHGYELTGTNKYVIIEDENYFVHNTQMLCTIEMLGGIKNPDCNRVIKAFNKYSRQLCPTGNKNELAKYYGKGHMWKDENTQGIVVKLIDDDISTYEILVECSRNCTGFKYSKFIPTDAECYSAAVEFLNNY